MKNRAVLISGYASLDSFVIVQRFRGLNETSTVLAFEGFEHPLPGGCACNIAVASARLGLKPLLVTALGEDTEGLSYLAVLHTTGVDTRLVGIVKGKRSPRTIIISDLDGNHVTLYYPAASDYTLETIKHRLSILNDIDLNYGVITVGDPQLTELLVLYLQQRTVPILWSFKSDMRAYPHNLIQLLLQNATYLICNEAEAYLLNSIMGLRDIKSILKYGLKGIIITMGDKGSQVIANDAEQLIPAIKASRIVDPTGAGDGFVAGVLFGLAHGLPPSISAQIGATVASFVLEAWGAQTALPSLSELEQRYRANFGQWPLKEER